MADTTLLGAHGRLGAFPELVEGNNIELVEGREQHLAKNNSKK
ncbi:hypothetical protein [Desulfonema magnum]|uniref:Uncharacterized protein n=1 Tax=Desulfonema magnum TaxID=45655 RepID=A0A975BGF2_9BACT|nr:hypothetical protein [Desulfonema magnum]QTA84833.1 Uncharacterized protein dnm_008340 [Desulfonema magnum]